MNVSELHSVLICSTSNHVARVSRHPKYCRGKNNKVYAHNEGCQYEKVRFVYLDLMTEMRQVPWNLDRWIQGSHSSEGPKGKLCEIFTHQVGVFVMDFPSRPGIRCTCQQMKQRKGSVFSL